MRLAAAAIVAVVERHALGLSAPLFPFNGEVDISLIGLLCWMFVGLVSGLLSGLLTRLVYMFEDGFLKLPIHWMWWPMIGGVVVGIGGLIDPRALGVGYSNIAQMLQGQIPPVSALLLLAVKAVIWSVALGSGTSGGVLAPLLIMGGAVGAALTTEVETLPQTMTLQQVAAFLASPTTRHPSFPVVDEDRRVLGIVNPPMVLGWRHAGKQRQTTLQELLEGQKLVTAYPDEYLEGIVDRMMLSNVAQMAVVSRGDLRLVGYVGWKDLLRIRTKLQAEESKRVVFFRVW